MSTTNRQPRWWSWSDIIRRVDQLGVPSFQRGAVWNASNCTALLESIYEQSPCGSFVLWAPTEGGHDPRRHGVPLNRFASDVRPMWLVDGQQRTRAMLETFQQLVGGPPQVNGWSLVRDADIQALTALWPTLPQGAAEESEGDDDEAEGDLHPWVAVLPAMSVFDHGREPYFGRHSESRNVRRGSMFRRLRPRARTRLNAEGKRRNMPPLPVGLIPLAPLLSPVGVFCAPQLHDAAKDALAHLDAGDVSPLTLLDDLLPWGPQFVTGHAYESPGSGHEPPTPMRWLDIDARRDEEAVHEMIKRLLGLFDPEWQGVFDRFADMLIGNRFAVGWLPPSDVSDAIDAYVRINRAGVRVRSEERALALMSRARPELLDDLAEFMRRRGSDESSCSRQALLAHESEKQMGFSVWMAAVSRYTTLALLGDSARRWLGVSAIDKNTFIYRLDRVGPGETETGKKTWARPDYATPDDIIAECAERATPALLLIDDVLSTELYLDHRMARPSSRALLPFIDLFYRIPPAALERFRGDSSFRAAIARLLHWTLLAPYFDQPELERFIVDIHGIDEELAYQSSAPVEIWPDAPPVLHQLLRAALARYQNALLVTWHRKHVDAVTGRDRDPVQVAGASTPKALTALAVETFASEVQNARSLQHPAVGWLYAIEHWGGATEFSWDAQLLGYSETGGKRGVAKFPAVGPETALELQGGQGYASPEKQHVVPFSMARQIVDKGGTRATASPSNAIGNLTWLSHRQNCLDALSDRWAVMDRHADRSNLAARGMLAPVAINGLERTAVGVYEELCGLVLTDSEDWRADREKAMGLFEPFCEARAAWLVDQMRLWLETPLCPGAAKWLGIDAKPPAEALGGDPASSA
jgi:hypothetical protein